LAEQSACDGSDDEAQSECRADHAQAFRAGFFVGNIGDVGLRYAQVSACDAVNDAADEEHPQGIGEAEQQKAEEGAEDADQQNRAASEAVREATENWRADQLHQRVGGDQNSSCGFTGFESFGIIRQQRKNQAEAEQVNKYH